METDRLYFRDMGQSDVLPQDEIRRLIALAQSGDKEARDKAILANMRLAMSITWKWCRANPKLDYQDLLSTATLGLIRAIDKFKLVRDVRFSTYASRWIKCFLGNHVADACQAINYPQWIRQYRCRINVVMREMEAETGATPTREGAMDRIGVLPLARQCLARADEIDRTALFHASGSIREFGFDGQVGELGWNLSNYPDKQPEESLGEFSDWLESAIDRLPGRKPEIVRRFFGLDRPRQDSFSIAEEFGMSHQGVSWTVHDSLDRLRKMAREAFPGEEISDHKVRFYPGKDWAA